MVDTILPRSCSSSTFQDCVTTNELHPKPCPLGELVVLLELVFEVLIYTIPQWLGRTLVYVLTFGKVIVEDTIAEVIGVVVLIALFILLIVFVFN